MLISTRGFSAISDKYKRGSWDEIKTGSISGTYLESQKSYLTYLNSISIGLVPVSETTRNRPPTTTTTTTTIIITTPMRIGLVKPYKCIDGNPTAVRSMLDTYLSHFQKGVLSQWSSSRQVYVYFGALI